MTPRGARVVARFAVVAAALAARPAWTQPATLDAAVEIGAAASFPADCPFEHPRDAPAFFRYRVDGAWRFADAAVALPSSTAEVSSWALHPEGFPDWVLVRLNGEAALRELRLDPDHGEATVQVGAESWRGRFTREAQSGAAGLRIALLDPGTVQEAYVELAVLPARGCAEMASIVTVRVAWKLGLLVRLMGGQLKLLPALLALRLRDDVWAHALRERGALTALFGEQIRFDEAGPMFVDGTGDRRPAPGDRLLGLTPCVLDSAQAAAAARALAARSRAVTVEDVLQPLQGSHNIVGCVAAVMRGKERWIVFHGGVSGDASYQVDVRVSDEGSDFVFSLWPVL